MANPFDVGSGQQSGPIRQVVVVQIPEEEWQRWEGTPVEHVPLQSPFNAALEEYRDWKIISHTFTLKPEGGAVLTFLLERSV